MADDKKPQPFPVGKPPPPNRPVGTITLEPGEELPSETAPFTSPPGGKQPPPRKPGGTAVSIPSGAEVQLYGGPQDGEYTTLKEAQEYFQKGYGYRDLATNRLVTARPQPQPQPTPQPTVGIKTRLAQPIKPIPTPEKPEIIAPYSKEDQIIIDEWKKVEEQLPPGPRKSTAQNFLQKAQLQAKKNDEEKNGPVPVENLPIIKKMIGEYKDFCFKGYAEIVNQAKAQAADQAIRAEEFQLYALRYGYSSLADLHRGLDEASWNFFFSLLGPLGGVLHDLKFKKIAATMRYYRSPFSPFYLDYLIKTLPEERAFDLVYNQTKKAIYYIGKLSGPLNPVIKLTEYDAFGRKRKSYYTFSPLVTLQSGLNTVGLLAERFASGNVMVVNEAYEKYQKALKTLSIDSDGFKKERNEWLNVRNKEENRFHNKLARFLGLKSIAKNIRRTDRDPISFVAILVGGWIFDVVAGNIARILISPVVERLAATKIGLAIEKFLASAEKYTTAARLTSNALGGSARAVFSLNTLGGGIIGYQLGGVPGAILGTGGGWFWQTISNMANDPLRVGAPGLGIKGWVPYYNELVAQERFLKSIGADRAPIGSAGRGLWENLQGKINEGYVRGLKFENPETVYKLFKWEWKMGALSIRPFQGMFAPGPLSQIANFLKNGEFNILGAKIPIGQLLKPLPSVFVNGTLVRWYVSPFLTELGTQLGWDPNIINIINSPFFQYGFPYLWETKGLWGNLLRSTAGKIFGGISDRLLVAERFSLPSGSVRIASFGGPGVGFGPNGEIIYERLGGAYYDVVRPTGLYKQVLNFQGKIASLFEQNVGSRILQFQLEHTTTSRFLSKLFNSLGEHGLTNLAGFFIGFEVVSLLMGGNLIAAFVGGVAGYLGANLVLETVGTLLGKFGINFVPLFNAGFWLTTIGQTILGFMGYSLPNIWLIPATLWAPVAGGFIFALSPLWLTYLVAPVANFLVAGTGAFVTAFATGLGSSIVGLTPLLVGGTIAVVAVTAIFAIIIIGSAFWVPISENLKGLTAVSPCFDISSPTFTDLNGNNSNAIFTKGETKTACWTITNKQDFYQDAVTETKTWNPPGSFTMEKYAVTINTPGGQVVWNNISGDQPGGYNLSVSPHQAEQYVYAGSEFKITPPKDTVKAQEHEARQIKQIYDQLNNKTKPVRPEELVAQMAIPFILASYEKDYILDKEINYLNAYINNAQQAADSESSLLKGLDKYDLGKQLLYQASVSSLPGTGKINRDTAGVISNCVGQKTYSSCETVNQLINSGGNAWPGWTNNPSQDLQNYFTRVKTLSPQELLATKDSLAQQRDVFQNQINKNLNSNSYPEEISQIQNISPSLTGTALDDAVNNLAKQLVGNSGLNYYLPAGSTITICLTLKYHGENGKVATLTEKDAANLPIAGPLAVPSCQAQLITPINAAGPGNLQWPTNERRIAGKYYVNPNNPADPNNHTGIDMDGTPGSSVTAAGSGTIIKEGTDPVSGGKSLGKYIIVQRDDGLYDIYGHLGDNVHGDDAAFIKHTGDRVNAKDAVGYFGNSGITIAVNGGSGAHLHYGTSTTASGNGATDFYDNSTTTLNPCGFFQGGCP